MYWGNESDAFWTQKFKEEWIDSVELQKELGVSRMTISRAISDGKFPAGAEISCKVRVWNREFIAPLVEAWKLEITKWRVGRGLPLPEGWEKYVAKLNDFEKQMRALDAEKERVKEDFNKQGLYGDA